MAGKRFNPTVIEEGLGAVAIAACIVSSPLLRPWYSKWGATSAEVKRSLPGDDLIPHPKLRTTRAITIQATAAEIWPWLVQMGQGRGLIRKVSFVNGLPEMGGIEGVHRSARHQGYSQHDVPHEGGWL